MVGPLLAAASLALALWAVREARRHPPRHVSRALLVFALGALALRGLLALSTAPWSRPLHAPALAGAALAGLVTWGATAWLAALAPRRRDLILRLPFGVIAVLLALARAPVAAIAFFTVIAALAFRWRDGLPTLRLFRLALLALVAALVLGGPVPALEPALARSAALADLRACADWAREVALALALLAVPALLGRFLLDPTLGIRTVGRRLALSHVLVVAIPLALIAGLWVFTTVLGVNSQRAMVGVRAVAEEGRQLQGALRTALARPESAPAALRDLARTSGDRWPELHLWRVGGGPPERLAGGPVRADSLLRGWVAGLDSLPSSGVLALGGETGLAAAARDGAGGAALALAPLDSVLRRGPAHVARARLTVLSGSLQAANGAVQVGGFGEGEEADSTQVAEHVSALAESLHAAGRARSEADRLERTRRVTRLFGVPDSMVREQDASRGGVHFTAQGDTFTAPARDSDAVPVLLRGMALADGLAAGRRRWAKSHYLLSASARPAEVLAGLYHDTRDNPLSYLPLVLVLLLSALAFLVAAFDVAMVTGMGRSITAALQALKVGARRMEKGDLGHRIEVRGDDDLWEVAATFNQASAGLERARALEKEAERLESELALARRIQARLLPAAPPDVPGLEIAGLSTPAREVGGDYFDHIALGDGRVMLVIADVSGKGVPAALLMSGFRASLMSQDCAHVPPDALAGRLNDFLLRSVEPGKFVTAFVAFLDGRDGRLVYANAGHNPPVLLRGDGAHELLATGGLILGILPGSRFESGSATLAPGDLVALYTDGVTEGADAGGEQWGEERLLEALRAQRDRPCAEIARHIADAVRAFEGASGPADDITLLIARRL